MSLAEIDDFLTDGLQSFIVVLVLNRAIHDVGHFGMDDTLQIEPGVEVFFSGYAKLYLRGTVRIEGTVQKPVAFMNADSSESWNGLWKYRLFPKRLRLLYRKRSWKSYR